MAEFNSAEVEAPTMVAQQEELLLSAARSIVTQLGNGGSPVGCVAALMDVIKAIRAPELGAMEEIGRRLEALEKNVAHLHTKGVFTKAGK